MARSFPADVKLQSFFMEQYRKENQARLDFYMDRKRGAVGEGRSSSAPQASYALKGLPTINPMQFARNMKREEEKKLQEIREMARQKYGNSLEEMKAPDPRLKRKLYHGFTKEEKGRYQYLRERKLTIPEKKYTFPVLSSWDYGWKNSDEVRFVKPMNARRNVVRDTFYTRNGIPCGGPELERSHTTV